MDGNINKQGARKHELTILAQKVVKFSGEYDILMCCPCTVKS